MAETQRHSDVAMEVFEDGSNGQESEAWAEMVGAFFEEHSDIAKMFEKFQAAYVSEKGQYFAAWQPLSSRFAALEQRVGRIQARIGGNSTAATLTRTEGIKVVTAASPPSLDFALPGADHSTKAQASELARPSILPLVVSATSGEQMQPVYHSMQC